MKMLRTKLCSLWAWTKYYFVKAKYHCAGACGQSENNRGSWLQFLRYPLQILDKILCLVSASVISIPQISDRPTYLTP
jgi:hypothetical protein